MRVRLNIPFASAFIAYNNIVKVYEADDANPSGRQIYAGIVGSLQRVNENGAEYVEMRALGLASMLSWLFYRKVTRKDVNGDFETGTAAAITTPGWL